MLSSTSTSSGSSSSSWSTSSWSQALGIGLQRKASGWLSSSASASASANPQSSSRPASSSWPSSSGANSTPVAEVDAASIASSSALSLASSCDSAILLDLADSLDSSEPLHQHHFFKGSPLVADPIASDDDVLPLVQPPAPSCDTPTSSTSSWRDMAKSALSSARVRLGSVSSIAPISVSTAATESPKVAASSTVNVTPTSAVAVVAPSSTPTPTSHPSTSAPVREEPAPTEYRLPWLGIGLPSTSRRALRSAILSLSHSRSTFTEPLNPDFPYSASLYSPLVELLLAEDPQLATMRAKLVPRTLTDREFWHNYLYRVSLAVTHAKLDAGVGGALLPLVRSCSGPMLAGTTCTVPIGRPRAGTMRSEHEASGASECVTDAVEGCVRGGGLVGLAAAADVDPMFLPLPNDGDDHDVIGESSSLLVIHDNLAETLSLVSDPSSLLLTASPTSSLSSDLSHLDDDETYLDHPATDDIGAADKPDDMDRMLEYDTDAFYVLLQDMALSAPLPVVHVPDTLPESSGVPCLQHRQEAEVGEDGMMVVSLE